MKKIICLLGLLGLALPGFGPALEAAPLTLTIVSSAPGSTTPIIVVDDDGDGYLEYADTIDGIIYDVTTGTSWPEYAPPEAGTLARLLLSSTNINNTSNQSATLTITLTKDYAPIFGPAMATAEGRFDMFQFISGVETSSATLQSWIVDSANNKYALYDGSGLEGTAAAGGEGGHFEGSGSAIIDPNGSYSLVTEIQVTLAPDSYMTFTEGAVAVTAVPEPASLLLFSSGIASLAMSARRRWNRKSKNANVVSA